MNNSKKRSKIFYISLIVVAAILASVFFWLKNNGYEDTDNAQLDGNIIPVKTSVTAYLKEVHFKDNQPVLKGDTLFVLDTAQLAAKVQEAEASLQNIRSNAKASEINALADAKEATAKSTETDVSQSRIEVAKADMENAQKNYKRIVALMKIQAATKEQYDLAEKTLQVAQSDYNVSISSQQVAQSNAKNGALAAQSGRKQADAARFLITQKEAELKIAENNLHNAYITAPTDGIVTKRSAAAGQYLITGQTLCALIETNDYWVTANLKETQLKNIRLGQKASIIFGAFPKKKFQGTVQSFEGATGAKFSLLPPDNATGNFIKVTQWVPVKIKLDADTDLKILFPGLSVTVKIKTNE